jgi:gluconolactonase
MISARTLFRFLTSAAFLTGCSAGPGDDADGAPDYVPTFNGAGGAGNVAAAPGAGGAAVSGGQGGRANPIGAAAGGAGNLPNGSSGAGGAPLSAGSGGTANSAGGSAGQAGAPGGSFVSVPRSAGASAAFVCGANQAFVNPFSGTVGALVTVPRPNPGYSFTEGPIWVAGLGALFFSDNVDPEKIWQLLPTSPAAVPTVLLNPSHSNGMALDNDDMLLVADQDGNKIVRVNPSTGAVLGDVVPAGNHRPNDLVLRSDGNLYFTDPNSAGRGFYRVSPTGALDGPFTQTNAPDAPNSPNGIVLSADENSLFVGDVNESFISSFSLAADGAVQTDSGLKFAENLNPTVDGMAVDCGGNLYVGTATGVQVLDAAGDVLGTLMQGNYVSNVTFGGPDRNTLYATSQGEIRSVTLNVRGLPN